MSTPAATTARLRRTAAAAGSNPTALELHASSHRNENAPCRPGVARPPQPLREGTTDEAPTKQAVRAHLYLPLHVMRLGRSPRTYRAQEGTRKDRKRTCKDQATGWDLAVLPPRLLQAGQVYRTGKGTEWMMLGGLGCSVWILPAAGQPRSNTDQSCPSARADVRSCCFAIE